MVRVLCLEKGARILDLACGPGRHSVALARYGYQVVGLDLSGELLRMAQSEAFRQGCRVSFVQGDMRELCFAHEFDAVINVFTSFGYFDEEKDNLRVLNNVARALRQNGRFLIDLNNCLRTVARMGREGQPDRKTGRLTLTETEKLSDGFVVTARQSFDFVTMRWLVERTWEENGRPYSLISNIRLYALPELIHLMNESGLRVEAVWGDFDCSSFGVGSRRLIILCRS